MYFLSIFTKVIFFDPKMTDISKIVDHIMSNVCLINSAGLYQGKAGIALALFEASRYLQDENVENEAFRLLQEALIHKDQDYTFENGWSGIGCVLCYLIENKLIEADFDKIFSEQYEKIIQSLNDIETKPDRLLNIFQVVYFLSMVKQKDDRAQKIIKKIFEGLELFLTIQFFDFKDIHYINDKMAVLRIYETYLKLVNYADYKYFSYSLLENYAELYRTKRVVSSVVIGYHIEMLTRKNTISGYQDVVDDNIKNSTRNTREEILLFSEQVDAMKLFYDLRNNLNQTINEGNMLSSVSWNSIPLSYKDGWARLLLFNVNPKIELL